MVIDIATARLRKFGPDELAGRMRSSLDKAEHTPYSFVTVKIGPGFPSILHVPDGIEPATVLAALKEIVGRLEGQTVEWGEPK